ncbi:11747_t:CDS:2, partial [Diversispora eburnea]
KFNPTMKKAKPDKKSNNKRNNIPMEETNTEVLGSKINLQIVILTNEKIIEDNVNTNIEVIEEIESRNNELQEYIVNGKENNNQGWRRVTNNKRKTKYESINKNNNKENNEEKEETESIDSYQTENDYHEKVEKVRKILKKETVVVLVKTEVFKDNRMISVLYDNEKEMEKGKQCDVEGNVGKPTYIHKAEIFRRNPVKELMHGVKLWDVPLGMKNKELKEDLENKYGEIERLTMRVNNMWQSAVAIFKEKEDVKKVMEKWSIIIEEDSLRVTQIDQTADNFKSRGEHVTRIIGLPNSITACELWPYVEKIGARIYYISRTRTYRWKNEAIVLFKDHET